MSQSYPGAKYQFTDGGRRIVITGYSPEGVMMNIVFIYSRRGKTKGHQAYIIFSNRIVHYSGRRGAETNYGYIGVSYLSVSDNGYCIYPFKYDSAPAYLTLPL